jgi:hypothetical protein
MCPPAPHHRDHQGHRGLDADVEDDVVDGHLKRVPEHRVLHHAHVVVHAVELRRGEQVEPGEAEIDPAQQRPHHEHQEADQRGQDEQERQPGVVTFAGAPDRCGTGPGRRDTGRGDGHRVSFPRGYLPDCGRRSPRSARRSVLICAARRGTGNLSGQVMSVAELRAGSFASPSSSTAPAGSAACGAGRPACSYFRSE